MSVVFGSAGGVGVTGHHRRCILVHGCRGDCVTVQEFIARGEGQMVHGDQAEEEGNHCQQAYEPGALTNCHAPIVRLRRLASRRALALVSGVRHDLRDAHLPTPS